jgi:two-component system OmpR family response regulator
MPHTIAIVEDDPDQRENYADALRRRGYHVETYENRPDAEAAFARALPDAAILDVMLGEEHDAGFELCKSIRKLAPRLPVIFLTARDSELDRLSGLRLDAWDYLVKPVTLEYLQERVAGLLRIAEVLRAQADNPGMASNTLVQGDLELNEDSMSVRWQGQAVDLTLTEFWIVQLLARNPEHVASYEELMQVTRQTIVEKNTINGHVRRIRTKFREIDDRFDCIRNVFGVGYRWNCER